MSLEKTPDNRFKVRWYDSMGKHRAKTFDKKSEAKAFDAELKRAKRLGTLQGIEAQLSKVTVGELGAEWWEVHGQNKAESTQRFYQWTWNSLIASQIGSHQVSSLTPADIEAWIMGMDDRGAAVRRKAMTLLHQILNFGIKKGYIQFNPVAVADKPKVRGDNNLVIPTPAQVESICKVLLNDNRLGDAMAIQTMAYAGLRPGEAWRVHKDHFLNGDNLRVFAHKTQLGRYVTLLEPLRELLSPYAEASKGLLFPNLRGQPFGRWDYNNWRRRIFQPAAPEGVTPYSLRHTFVSLLVADPGYSRTDVAEEAGHSLKTQERYAHRFPPMNAEEAIRAARMEVFGDVPKISPEDDFRK